MGKFSGVCDLYDHIMMKHHRTKSGSDKKEDLEKASGRLEAYHVKNVFDLAGNKVEWISAADWDNRGRLVVGCNDNINDPEGFPASVMYGGLYFPGFDKYVCTTRVALYVKSAKTDALTALTNPNVD